VLKKNKKNVRIADVRTETRALNDPYVTFEWQPVTA
jgi:hypothetical protein